MACENNCNSIIDMSCVDRLKSLHDTYYRLISGERELIIEQGDSNQHMKVVYRKGDEARVAQAYNALYVTCGNQLPAGYPVTLDTAVNRSSVQRGNPSRCRVF